MSSEGTLIAYIRSHTTLGLVIRALDTNLVRAWMMTKIMDYESIILLRSHLALRAIMYSLILLLIECVSYLAPMSGFLLLRAWDEKI